MKFGLDSGKKLNGATLYVYVLQICSLMPLLYIIVATGYFGLTAGNNILSYIFDVGMSSIPRAEALCISFLYRHVLSEVLVYFILAGTAFVFGVIANKLLKSSENAAIKTRTVFIVLICIDLVLRALPFGFNIGFGLVPAIIGAAIRIGCLLLIILDLKAHKKEQKEAVTE